MSLKTRLPFIHRSKLLVEALAWRESEKAGWLETKFQATQPFRFQNQQRSDASCLNRVSS